MADLLGTAIKGYAYFSSGLTGKTGLTVTCYVNAPDGTTNLVSAGSAPAVDATNMPGLYAYTLAATSVTQLGFYTFNFRTTDTTVNAQQLQAIVEVRAPSGALYCGTASAGGANTITLAGGVATDNLYKYCLVEILAGTGIGQSRLIIDYVGSSKVATVQKSWTTNPDSTSVFAVMPFAVPAVVHSGIAQAGAASTITLQSIASATDNLFNGLTITIFSGTGAGQARTIKSYVGSTKVATVNVAWVTNPSSDSVYEISALGPAWADVYQWSGGAVPTPNQTGVPIIDFKYALGTAITEGAAGRLAAAITKFFNVATPTGTVNSLPDAVAGAANGLFIAGTNAATTITTALTANITGNLSGSVGSVVGAVGSVAGNVAGSVGSVLGNVAGSVASVVGNVGGNVTGSVGSVVATVTAAVASIAANAVTGSAIDATAVTKIQAGLSTLTAQQVWEYGTRTLSSFGTLVADIWAGVTQAFYAKFLTQNTGLTWTDAVAGSVAKLIADNASTSPTDIASAVWDSLVANFSAISGSFGAGFAYILAQVAKIGTSSFTMNAPGVILPTPPLVTNRAYKFTYGNQISFTVENLSISLQATGVTAQWRFKLGGTNPTPFIAVITSPTTGYFEVNASDTASWGASPQGGYEVEFVVLDGTTVIHVQSGKKIVQVGITPTP